MIFLYYRKAWKGGTPEENRYLENGSSRLGNPRRAPQVGRLGVQRLWGRWPFCLYGGGVSPGPLSRLSHSQTWAREEPQAPGTVPPVPKRRTLTLGAHREAMEPQ